MSVWRIAVAIFGVLVMSTLSERPAFSGEGSVDAATGDVDFTVNMRFPATSQQLDDYQQAISQMAFGLCDATDGQMRVRKVTINSGQAGEDAGDFWAHARDGRSGGSFRTDGKNLGRLGSHLNMYSSALTQPDVWLHEFGHHGLGLGEQYDEQRRYGGECGIGRGFDAGGVDERNHSIMQQSGKMECVGGATSGSRCLSNTDCGTGTCQFVLMSEMSVPANHDLTSGTNTICPAPQPISDIELDGSLNAGHPVQAFDGSTFAQADATSSYKWDREAIDDIGALPAERLFIYATHTAPNTWQISALIDAKMTGGAAGEAVLVEAWTLTFNPNGSLASVSETPAEATISGLATGASDLDLTFDFGTPDPTGLAGFDGLREDPGVPLSISSPVFPGCQEDNCAARWSTVTSRWETTHQSLLSGGASDWETVVANYPFLTLPGGLPQENAPAGCFRAVDFDIRVTGSDQVMLIMDKSGSMAWSSKSDTAEVCGNSIDDDSDGTVDESDCGDARIEFTQAAARAFIDLQTNVGIEAGLMEFDDGNTLIRQIDPLSAANANAFKTDIDAITPNGNTHIGDALNAAEPDFSRVAAVGRNRTAYLMTDGYNTGGVAPEEGAARLDDIGVRVHVIPAGTDVDSVQLAGTAAASGGSVFPAEDITEVAAVYAELAARHQGAALVMPRINIALSDQQDYPPGYDVTEYGKVMRVRGFLLPVEEGARRLAAFVSGRNNRMATWNVDVRLTSPSGVIYDASSPELVVDSHYLFIDIANPEPGDWEFYVEADGPGVHYSTALAFVENPMPDLFVDVQPRVIEAGSPAVASVSPVYVGHLEPDGLNFSSKLEPPYGPPTATDVVYDDLTRSYTVTTPPLTNNGFYRIEVALEVDESAQLMAGEPIFDGPERPAVSLVPFERVAQASFAVINGEYACKSPNDCDGDGVDLKDECLAYGSDIDGDGRPNPQDPDSDGDEIPDNVERGQDRNNNTIPDQCEPAKAGLPLVPVQQARRLEEDCLPLSVRSLSVDQSGRTYRLMQGRRIVQAFGPNASEANRVLALLRHYRADQMCYVGRPGPSLTYILSGSQAPLGPMRGDDCLPFDPDQVEVKEVNNSWKIVQGGRWLFDFGDAEDEARQSLAVIEKYGFTHSCFVGRPDPSFTYLRN